MEVKTKQIRAAMVIKGTSVRKLAPIIGVARNTLNNLINGRVEPKLDVATKLCALLDLDHTKVFISEGNDEDKQQGTMGSDGEEGLLTD